MRTFTLTVIGLLALTAFGIFNLCNKEQTYTQRLADIAKKINSQNGSWKAVEPTRFQDLKEEHVRRLMGTLMTDKDVLPDVTEVIELQLEAPDSFDSATNWPGCESIQEVRDQSDCGSCWAFGAVEAMSDRICIVSGQTDQTRISAEDLVSCCSSCGFGCNGGYPSAAWSYFERTGLVTGGLYGDDQWCQPYSLAPCAHHTTSAKYDPCPASEYPTPRCSRKCNANFPGSYTKDKHHGRNAYSVRGETKMKAELSQNGPFEVALTVYEDFLTYQ